MKLALVGAGRWGRLHAAKIAAMEGVDLAAVVDRDLRRAREVASLSHGCVALREVSQLPPDIEGASVAVSLSALYSVATQLLQRRIHVLVEKPMATNLGDGRVLAQMARAQNRLLAVGYLERFNPGLASMRGRTDSLLAWRAGAGEPRCGPMTLDWTVHDLDLAHFMLGSGLAFRDVRRSRDGVRIDLSSTDGARARVITRQRAGNPRRQLVMDGQRFELGGYNVDLLALELGAFRDTIRGFTHTPLALGSDACAVLAILEDAQRLHRAA